jgi:DNA-directed RNA polymerase subunit M/transcription elongation factor TFIIS
MEVEVVRMELKYCERCGGLLVRAQDSEVTYCASCAVKMAELPRPRVARRKARTPVAHPEDTEVIGDLGGATAAAEAGRWS